MSKYIEKLALSLLQDLQDDVLTNGEKKFIIISYLKEAMQAQREACAKSLGERWDEYAYNSLDEYCDAILNAEVSDE